jgi:hypothetical protein
MAYCTKSTRQNHDFHQNEKPQNVPEAFEYKGEEIVKGELD